MGVPPALIGDVLAISGDSVDNIPGVGIGRKTAAGLILEHGGLESLLGNLGAVKSLKSREKLQNGRDQILQNRKMVELDCRTELPVPIDQLRIRPDYPGLIAALEKCEFKSLLQEVRDEASRRAATARDGAKAIGTEIFRKNPRIFEQRQKPAVKVVRLRRFG